MNKLYPTFFLLFQSDPSAKALCLQHTQNPVRAYAKHPYLSELQQVQFHKKRNTQIEQRQVLNIICLHTFFYHFPEQFNPISDNSSLDTPRRVSISHTSLSVHETASGHRDTSCYPHAYFSRGLPTHRLPHQYAGVKDNPVPFHQPLQQSDERLPVAVIGKNLPSAHPVHGDRVPTALSVVPDLPCLVSDLTESPIPMQTPVYPYVSLCLYASRSARPCGCPTSRTAHRRKVTNDSGAEMPSRSEDALHPFPQASSTCRTERDAFSFGRLHMLNRAGVLRGACPEGPLYL